MSKGRKFNLVHCQRLQIISTFFRCILSVKKNLKPEKKRKVGTELWDNPEDDGLFPLKKSYSNEVANTGFLMFSCSSSPNSVESVVVHHCKMSDNG